MCFRLIKKEIMIPRWENATNTRNTYRVTVQEFSQEEEET